MSWPWSQLGLSGPASLSEVRHAYAEKLKITHPEEDPEGFQRLHSAFQLASRMARQQKRREPSIPPERPPRQEPAQTREEGFDYDELLREGGESPRRPPREEEQDFDFDELLQKGGERPSRPPEEEEEDFDFDELLQEGGESPRRPGEEERDFDFERLFAEGEAERAESRRQRAEERRRAQAQAQARARERQKAREWSKNREFWQRQEEQNTYDRERRNQFDQEQIKWQNTETILHTIEMLYSSGAGEGEWQRFFQSPLFQQNKGSIDLIFGLEDFVSSHPDLPRKVQIALFTAYGFDKGVSRPELRPLYQMLLSAWQREGEDRRRDGLYKFLGVIGGIVGVLVAGAILTSALLPVFLVLGGLLLYGLNRGWFKRQPGSEREKRVKQGVLWLVVLGGFTYVCWERGWGLKIPLAILAVGAACLVIREVIRSVRRDEKAGGRPRNRRDERWIVAVTAACLAMGISMLFMPELKEGLSLFSKAEDPRKQVCRYLELDYGGEFRSLYSGSAPRFDNVFASEDSSNRLFLAGPDGDRVVREGKLGYTTNYPEMMVLWRLREFAAAHKLSGLDTMDRNQNLESWNTTGVFLIVLPEYGAGETIADLGELLDQMAREDWYQVRPPEFKVVLCSRQMKEGRVILQEYESAQGDFDAQAVRALYEESFGHACCGQLLKELDLDRDFVHGGEERYTLTGQGMARCKGEDCFLLYGLDGEGAAAMEYYISVEGGSIFCVPSGFWDGGGTDGDIQFYRMISREDSAGIITLFYPWITVS